MEHVEPELLEILVCPKCKGDLEVRRRADGSEEWLDCRACALAFPVDDGIPVMLVEEATAIQAG